MKKSVSFLAIMLVGVMSAVPSNGAQMTSQIRRLLDQKDEKIKKLEECEGKKKGWMIAGISTIGLTAVGVGVNIAQASKSNKLSGEIDATKSELERQQNRLSEVEGQISAKEREKVEREKAERERAEREKSGRENGQNAESEVVHNDYKDREPDGKIGEPCDEGRGIWVIGGDKLCVDAGGNGLQECQCEPKTTKINNTDKTTKKPDGNKKPGELPTNKSDTNLDSLDKHVQSNCYTSVEDYLALSCKKCINQWAQIGYDICEHDIDNHNGYWKVEQKNVVFYESEPSYTPMWIFAKDGHSVILNCDGVCADFDAEDAKNCRISGGEWRYSNQLKKYECHCGTIGSYTDRHMKLTKDNTCVCQSGYVLIDENQPIKGCRLGSNQVEQDNFIKSVNTMQAKWNSMSTKIRQCEVATTNVATAGDFDKAQNFVNQARQYASDAVKLVGDIKDLYQTITATYRELESVDKKAVSRHKESADRMKTDADNTQTIVNNYINQAQTELMRMSQKQNTTQNTLENACVDSHGQPDGNSCKCDASKNLIPNGPNACTCKTVGKNKYEWHDRCNMCRAPSAVDKDLPCGV